MFGVNVQVGGCEGAWGCMARYMHFPCAPMGSTSPCTSHGEVLYNSYTGRSL